MSTQPPGVTDAAPARSATVTGPLRRVADAAAGAADRAYHRLPAGVRRTTGPIATRGRANVVAIRHLRDLQRIERFCWFLGYPRSGHSLVGSLLNAHPDAVIAHEADTLRWLADGMRRHELFGLLLARDSWFGAAGRTWTGYDYTVPGQWQGRWRHLRVLGDKKGAESAAALRRDPWLLDHLRTRVGIPLRTVHVTRHPLDNVARMALRSARGGPPDLEAAARHYLDLVAVVERSRTRIAADEWIDVRHEDVVADPVGELDRLCRFIGVEPSADYLEACASIVFDAPRRSRDEVTWTPEALDLLARGLEEIPILRDYDLSAIRPTER